MPGRALHGHTDFLGTGRPASVVQARERAKCPVIFQAEAKARPREGHYDLTSTMQQTDLRLEALSQPLYAVGKTWQADLRGLSTHR